jgi:hypothetical protein
MTLLPVAHKLACRHGNNEKPSAELHHCAFFDLALRPEVHRRELLDLVGVRVSGVVEGFGQVARELWPR